MAAVEHPQLHFFVRQHVVDQFGADLFPRRTPLWEVIFYYPLAKGLAGDSDRIDDTTQ
ncbi:hypothetical protein D3C85_1836420 [compost metagenome]